MDFEIEDKGNKKENRFFQDLSQIYWGIPNAFFVPGKKQ
jgi:hypothetical protein